MISIASGQTKGGTGKTSVSVHLSVTAAHLFQRKTVLIDIDVQRSATKWGMRRNAAGPVVISSDAASLPNLLGRLAGEFDFCVVDVPGHDLNALSNAAVNVDLTLLVTRPNQLDIEPAVEVCNVLKQFQLPHALLISQAPPRPSMKLASWMEAYSRQGEVISTMITSLAAYQDAITLGMGVEEYEPQGRAAREMRAVFEWLMWRLKEKR